MKWCIVISLAFLCCGAEKYKIETVHLPTPDSAPSTRIIGGAATTIEKFPYAVQVQYNNRLSCGGSLITRRHVLSAAHCFFDDYGTLQSPSRYTIRAGSANLQSGGTVRSVSMIIVHERYNTPIRDNDVAVLLLASSFSLNSRVAIAKIPAQGEEVPDNSLVIHIGWGRTNVNVAQTASVLQEVTIRTINFDICYSRYAWLTSIRPGELYIVTRNMICSGLLDIGGADACQGDSGGPLIYSGIVVGITSWGYGCAQPLFPGVNAKVSAYTRWINDTVTRYNAGPPAATTNVILLSILAILSSSVFASR